jgi:hypothetical protein
MKDLVKRSKYKKGKSQRREKLHTPFREEKNSRL